MTSVKACINEIKSSGRELESPDSESRRIAKNLQKPYVIPIRVGYLDNQNGNKNFVTTDKNGDLNYVVVTSRDGKIICQYTVE
ncbi:hypothetical protein BGT96224_Ac31552 [Blumeria graminis f. sp. tritici 96224]|nr:hypothetical protein BGT96224_Ac31552 [Blumeria graminis f. sp. tritici 96224]